MTTTRRKYKKDGFSIDLDSVDFGYTIAEVEYMAKDGENLKEATDKIIEFGRKNAEVGEYIIRGKAIKYLEIYNPKHLQALIDAKVIK